MLKAFNANDDDIVFISCPDEMLREESFDMVKNILDQSTDPNNVPIVMFKHWLYAYKFNLLNKTPDQADTTSMATRCSTYRKTLPATLRDKRICSHIITDAGWHFCFMDGKDERSNLADSINRAYEMRSPTTRSQTKITIDPTLEGVASDVKPKKFKR